MTTTPPGSSAPSSPIRQVRRRGLFADNQRSALLRFPFALTMTELSAVFLISALVDLLDSGDVTVPFLLASVVCAGVGIPELRRVPMPQTISAPAVMTMATLSFALLAIGGAVAHLIGDATDEIDTAILEGTAPATTTAMTTLDVDGLPDGLLMFRALAQWLGGFGALLIALIVIPLIFRGRGVAHAAPIGAASLIRGRSRGVDRVMALYCGSTAVLVIAFAITGMGLLDSVGNAMATISTGGLTTRTGSLGAFDNAAAEWVAAVGMAFAGLNLGVVWWLIRRDSRSLRSSTELRVYLAVMTVSIILVAGWVGADHSASESIRSSAVAVTSAMSTTGLTTYPWWSFEAGAQALLLVLVGIGAMSGSAGGGFQYRRLLQSVQFSHRELRRQLHPSEVAVVRVNDRPIDERSLEYTTGYIVIFVLAVVAGGMLIELGDSSVSPSAAISLSISALATNGAQVLEPVDLGNLGPITKISLSALMLTGRLFIYAVILTTFNMLVRLGQHTRGTMWDASRE